MAEAKMTVELGITQNKQEFEQVSKSIENLLFALNGKRNNASDNQITKSLNEQYKIVEKMALAYDQAFDNKIGQINISKLNEEMKKSNVTIQQFRQAAAQGGQAGAVAYNQFANSVLNANVQIKQSNQLLDKMATTFKNTVRYGISSSIFNNFTNSIRKAYEYTVQLDTSLNDIRIVSNQSAEQMNEFAVSANKTAQALGKTTLDYTKAATIYFQQGLSREEVEARTEATLKAANVTGQNAQDVSEQLTAVWNGYRVANDELELYVDKLAAVAAHSASNLKELSTGMSKVASAANVMGVDIDQLTAQMSTIISVTRQAPESVGTALRTIYARIADINAGMDEETTLGNYSGKMAKLGFNVLDANGKLKDMGAVIEEIGAKWTSLDREQQIALARTMAGTRQYNNLLTLFDNWDKYEDALDTAANAAGTLQRQQDIYMESTEAHLKQMQAEAEKTYSILFDQEAARGFIDTVTSGFSLINTYLDSMNKASLSLGGAWGQIATLGANIFSKQIASGISGHLQNKRAFAENQAQFKSQKDVLSKDYLTEDYDTNVTLASENRYQNRNALAKASVGLSNDKYQEAVEQEKELFALQSKKGELLKQFKADYQEYTDLANKVQQTEEKANGILEKAGPLTEEENQALRERDELLEKFEQSKIKMSGYTDEDRADAQREDELTTSLQKTIAIGDEQNRINTIIRGTTALLGTWNNVQSGINILTDENASSWEKFQGIVGVAISQGMLLLTSYSSLINLFPALALQVGAYTKAELIELAVKKGLVAEGTKELTVEQAKLTVQSQGVLTLIKDTIAKAADTLATKLHIDKLWEEFRAQTAVNIAKSNFIALAFAAIAATAALTVAIGMWIASLFKSKTEEEKLQEAVEETNKKLQETKDAYKELKDTVSNYQSAKEGLEQLTEGTVEFYDAILKANEEAQDLIDKWGLIAGANYTIDENGLININEDTLKRGQFYEQQSVYRASAQSNQARADLQDYYVEQTTESFKEALNDSFKESNNLWNQSLPGPERINYDLAESMLDKWSLGKDVADNVAQGAVELGALEEKILTSETYQETESESTKEITNAIKTYLPQYNSAKAQSNALKRQQSDALIRGYGRYEDVEVYNKMSSTQKQLLQDAMTENRERFMQNDFSDIATDMYLSPYGEDAQEYIQKYLQEAYGYIWDATTETWTNNLGNIVTQSTIDKIIEDAGGYDDFIEEAIATIINSGGLTASSDLRRAVIYSNQAKDFVSLQGAGNENLSAQRYVAEAFSSLKLGQQYNFGILTDEEIEILNKLLEQDYNQLQPWQKIMQPLQQIELTGNTERSEERQAQDLAAYNEELKEQAKNLETSTNALKLYAAAMKNADKLTGNQNQEMAEAIAESYKFNKSYNEAVKIYEKNTDAIDEWTEAWKNHKQVSYETADAMGSLYEELTNIFGADFNLDLMINNMDLVKQMLTGTEEEAENAYRALESLNIQDLFNKTFGEEAVNNIFTTDSALADFADHVANLDFGENIGKEYFNQLKQIVNASKMTKEEVETLFHNMNLTVPDLKMTEHEKIIPGSTTRHWGQGEQMVPGPDGTWVKQPVNFWWDDKTEDKKVNYVSIDDNVKYDTVKSTGGRGGFQRTPSNSRSSAGKSGSGGGSNAKPSQKDPNKDELDRYQLVNVQLKEISKELTKLDKEKNKLLGGKLLANLNNQIKLLNDQITVTEAKLKIAKQEQSEVAGKLAGFGVQFDSEGNIANYAQIFRQEQAKLNAVYSAFNSMSKDSQDAYQDTVKAAEETWKTFKDSISKYDNLIGETIPQLYQDIRDAFDKQTEMFIQEFNMEVKLRLDMSSAMRDWNEFRRKVIDGIKDDDILGTAKAKLADFESYYNAAGKAEIQALTKQLQGQLEELRKQDATGSAEWYRDNRAKAIEDLKDNYDKIRDSLTEIIKLEEEMQQKVLDMMDQAQDKFDEQIGTFENINKHLEHNIQLINLLTDENDYAELSKQYAAQTKNREQELDFYTKQRDYWENYLKTLEEGSKEWDEAKAKYNEAAEAWASALETTIEAARKEFENNIKLIFQTINNQLTDNKGLEYLNEQWELLSDNSNMVLDNINKMQKFQDLTKKYNDAINSTSNIAAQKKLAQLRDQELAALKGIDNLNEKDLERAEKKLDIIKAQIALEDAQRNKTQMRLRRDSQGNYRYQFVADEEEVQRAQQDLANAYNELYNFDKERYKSNLNDAYAAWNDYQEKMAEAALINDPEVRGEREALLTKEYNERILILTEENERIKQELNESTIAELNSLYAQNADNYELMTEEQKAALNDFNAANQTAFDLVFDLYTENTEKFRNMTQDQLDIIENQMVPQWTSGYQTLIDKIEGEGGIEDVSADLAEQLHNEADSYKQDLGDIQVAAGQTFGEISDSQNDIIQNTKDMLEANDGLISEYTEMTDAVMDQYSALKDLMNEYEQAAKDAKQAAEDAYNYIMREKEDEAKAAAENVDNGPTTGGTGNYNPTPEPAPVTPAPVAVENTVPSTPFTAVIPQGTNLYDIDGNKYRYGTKSDRTVTVQDTSGELWRVWGSTFDPHVVYVNRHALGYDTGGYTGDWGNDGRLAFLHQKELVLNKEDTANMLNAVEILRGITANIGADILGKLASASAISMNGAIGNNTLDQNVHIEATFPGVTSSIEIQDALNNLVNMASQKVLQR